MVGQSLEPLQKTRLFCNRCKGETNHQRQASCRAEYDDDHGFWEQVDSILWMCAGCEKCVLEERWTWADYEDPQGKRLFDSSFYPKRNRDDLSKKTFKKLSKKLNQIYREVIGAYNGELDVLCATGLRSLVEGICADKKVAGNNLHTQIKNLINYHLPQNIVDGLDSFRFMGNIAVHELTAPERTDLGLAIEISEDLLNYFYDLDYKTNRLANRQKARQSVVTKPA